MRYNDVRDCRYVVEEVKCKYKAAWDKKNMIESNGLYPDAWLVKQDRMVQPNDIGLTAWYVGPYRGLTKHNK